MPELEKYIREHLGEFNSFEPEQDHFGRFQNRMSSQPVLAVSHTRSRLLKVAALIVILISVSVIVVEFVTREIGERFVLLNQGSELPLEITEAIQYYDNQAMVQMGTLNTLASCNSEAISLNETALSEISKLNLSTAELKNTLLVNPGNEHILDAIIQNQQMKESILNNIIKQLSQSKK
jgi:hypothetical protein